VEDEQLLFLHGDRGIIWYNAVSHNLLTYLLHMYKRNTWNPLKTRLGIWIRSKNISFVHFWWIFIYIFRNMLRYAFILNDSSNKHSCFVLFSTKITTILSFVTSYKTKVNKKKQTKTSVLCYDPLHQWSERIKVNFENI
jgi:hypothetical protein